MIPISTPPLRIAAPKYLALFMRTNSWAGVCTVVVLGGGVYAPPDAWSFYEGGDVFPFRDTTIFLEGGRGVSSFGAPLEASRARPRSALDWII
mmetsp:Transcript_56150/g.76584  ORF Transcript_56150/g.76584 Transcript_56150/m.76584 type:complete len:93 (-) Transcript_56150:1112-1390(-)